AAIAAMPADPDPRSRRPAMDFGPDRIDCADDLVPGNARIFDIREQPLFGDAVAVADAAGLDLDPDLAGGGFRDLPLDQLERPFRKRNLGCAHLRHGLPPR